MASTTWSIQALEWLDQNMHTRYPFAFPANQGTVPPAELPSSFIVDMKLALDDDIVGSELAATAADAKSGFSLTAVSATARGYVVELSYANGGDSETVAVSDEIPRQLPTDGDVLERRTFAIRANGGHGNALDRISGSLVIGTCSDMRGPMAFAAGQVPLLPSNVLLVDAGLRSVTVGDRTLTGDFTLEGGPGIELSVSDTADGTVVTVSSTVASAAAYDSVDELMSAVLSALGDPIRRINGSGPDADGNIRIRGGDCTQVDTDAAAGSIRISNPCSRPCCGSASQEQLSSAIAQLETAQRRLSEYYQALTNNVNAVQARLASLIAAK